MVCGTQDASCSFLLSTVAAATITVNPIQLWGDVGWYLSFGSFAGVIILAPLINELLAQLLGRQSQSNNNSDADTADLTVAAKLARKLGGIPGSLVQILVETTSAQIVTLPIIAWFMGCVRSERHYPATNLGAGNCCSSTLVAGLYH